MAVRSGIGIRDSGLGIRPEGIWRMLADAVLVTLSCGLAASPVVGQIAISERAPTRVSAELSAVSRPAGTAEHPAVAEPPTPPAAVGQVGFATKGDSVTSAEPAAAARPSARDTASESVEQDREGGSDSHGLARELPGSPDADAAFERLRRLVGEWRGTTPSGREITVAYRMSAGETVLVETWTLGPGRESLTLYHRDGDDLLATHYCPLGNQPRLVLESVDGPTLVFEYRSATNLPDPAAAHQSHLELRLDGPDAFWRSETYLENGVAGAEAIDFARVASAGSRSGSD